MRALVPGRRALAAARLIALVALVATAAGCGKVGAPQPPVRRSPTRPTRLAAVQVGDKIRLSWSAANPDLRASSPSAIRRADVYRLRQARGQTPIAFDDDFEEAADIVGFLDYDRIKQQFTDDGRLVYEDTLDLSQPAALANTRFQYAVRFVDGRGRPQALSNIVSLEPVPGIARPPSAPVASESQDAIQITWTPPTENIDGTTPVQLVGFNIYRAKPNADRLGRPLNDQPLTEPRYVDRNFLYLTPYYYVIRSVSQGPDERVESIDSPRLEITPRDVFAPTAPTNLTVASAAGVISLFWPSNPERDVVGYRIYRVEGDVTGSAATAQWVRLTEKPHDRTTYRDERVRTGARYSYRITAVDRYGNESPPSAVVAETASP